MIPIGYMAKKVETAPDYLRTFGVTDIYSVSNHDADNLRDCEYYHQGLNAHFLFDDPDAIRKFAKEAYIDLSGKQFFYYEAHEEEYDMETKQWTSLQCNFYWACLKIQEPLEARIKRIKPPAYKRLHGYDVVLSMASDLPVDSILSRPYVAETTPVNQHCLLSSEEKAKELLESATFDLCDPGPYRIYAVYTT